MLGFLVLQNEVNISLVFADFKDHSSFRRRVRLLQEGILYI